MVDPRLRLLAVLLLGLSACAARPSEGGDAALHVFAASSLTEATLSLAEAYEQTHPGTEVRATFGGSQLLRTQIEAGAPAGVFATAEPAHADALARSGRMRPPEALAETSLALIVPAVGSSLHEFAALARAERIVLGAPAAPIGHYTDALLSRAAERYGAGFSADVRRRVVSEEPNVRLVRAKVALGEADAAIVYAPDAIASDAVRALPVPAGLAPRVRYAIAATPGDADAEAFVRFARSPAGVAILRDAGFDPPSS